MAEYWTPNSKMCFMRHAAGSNPCGDHFFFHPKFHYINIVLLLLFLLPIAGSKAVCIANYETVTKPNLTIPHTLDRVNKLRVAAPGASLNL